MIIKTCASARASIRLLVPECADFVYHLVSNHCLAVAPGMR